MRRRSSFRILSVKMTVEAMEVTTNDKEKEKEKETETEKKDPDTLSLEGKYQRKEYLLSFLCLQPSHSLRRPSTQARVRGVLMHLIF